VRCSAYRTPGAPASIACDQEPTTFRPKSARTRYANCDRCIESCTSRLPGRSAGRSSPAASSTEKQGASTRLSRGDALSEVIAWTSYPIAPGIGSQHNVHVAAHDTRPDEAGVATVETATCRFSTVRLSTRGGGAEAVDVKER
jgi:hypothetical protein